jgi:ABC-type dipeptide/oligopeptide/nickel transport system ATPase component
MKTKISYDLRLKEGVGPINLGMSRQEVRSILGESKFSSGDSLYKTSHYTPISRASARINKGAISSLIFINIEIILNISEDIVSPLRIDSLHTTFWQLFSCAAPDKAKTKSANSFFFHA